jgi:hypothetical protein
VTADRLKRGDYVRVRLVGWIDGEWTPAFVALASDTDPASVMLLFDGAVRASNGLIANSLPLTINYQAETVTSLMGDSYEIEVPVELAKGNA